MRLFAVSCLSVLSLVACKSSTGGGVIADPDAPAITGEKYTLSWGPVTVHPGEENTQCVDVKLTNPAEIKVHQIHNTLSTGSHHVIIYRNDKDTVEKTTPYDCKPFTGALNSSGMVAPMMITQKQDDLLTLPDTVAYTLKPNQMVRMEMHYINKGDADLTLTATSDIYAADTTTIHNEANILFIGSPDVDLPAAPASPVYSLEQYFSASSASVGNGKTLGDLLTDAKFFAITGHTHQWGTNVTVDTRAGKGGAATLVYTPSPFQWSEPLTQTHTPEFSLPTGGGFNFKCEYNNKSAGQVEVPFGESANNEMCFFWAYYYPSQGAFVCFHSDKYSVDLCCPGGPAQLCQAFGGN